MDFPQDVEFVSGSCFRINPEGTLKGKSGDYGVLSLILLADRDEYVCYNIIDRTLSIVA